MPNLNWKPDQQFYDLARAYPFGKLEEAVQYQGIEDNFEPFTTISGQGGCVNNNTSPDSIIDSAVEENWLCFLLKVGRWGNMIPGPYARPMRNIYGHRNPLHVTEERLTSINNVLSETYEGFSKGKNFEEIWRRFDDLNWSNVIRSKCLHFQARAANIEGIIPIPVDGLMSNQWLWRGFEEVVRARNVNQWPRPAGITGNTFTSYNRYFSAMVAWADNLEIDVHDLEIRLFQLFRTREDGQGAPFNGQ